MATDPYNRIMRAAKSRRGVRLSPEEVWELAQDSAIETRALAISDGEAEERPVPPWLSDPTTQNEGG